MLSRLRGHRARLTLVQSGETVPVRVVNSEGDEAVAILEHRDHAQPHGSVIVEVFADQKYLIFPAEIGKDAPPQAVVFRTTGKGNEAETGAEFSLLFERLPVIVKFNFKKIKTHIIGGGPEGMAIMLDAAIPANTKVEVTIDDDGRLIETEGYITHLHKRGKGFMAIYMFTDMPRVTSMYWNRILKSG